MKKILCLSLAVLLLTGCGVFPTSDSGDDTRYSGRFQDYITSPLGTLNMYTTADTVSINTSRFCIAKLYVKLINQDKNGYYYAPDLAKEDPESISSDGTVWRIRLRDDYFWANGEQITAFDFVYSMKQLLDPRAANKQTVALTSGANATIKGAYDYALGKTAWDSVGIEAEGKLTLKITCQQPATADKIKQTFELPYTMVVYEPLFEECRLPDGTSSYGTSLDTFMSAGPFILTKWEQDAKYSFDINPDYVHADEYSIEGLDVFVVPDGNTALELFLSGSLDYLTITYAQWEAFEDDPRVYEFWGNSLQYMFVNLGNPNQNNILGDLDFRKALYFGADRVSLSETIGAIPATRLVRKAVVGDPKSGTAYVDLPGADDFVPDGASVYNPSLAREYLSKALEKAQLDSASLEIYYGESANHSKAASEIMLAQYNKLFDGKLKVELRSVPAALQYNLRRWNPSDPTAFEASIGSITPSPAAPHYTFQYYTSTYSPPRFCYSNPQFDALYEKAVSEEDPLKSAELCMELEKIILEDLVIVPLYELPSKALFSERVTLPAGGFINDLGFGYEFGSLKSK